jgi:hypothetical protein
VTERSAGQRARREFIRTHHPDRGGDPAVFVAGLARLDGAAVPARRPGPGHPAQVIVLPDRSWLVIAVAALARRAGWPGPPPRVR